MVKRPSIRSTNRFGLPKIFMGLPPSRSGEKSLFGGRGRVTGTCNSISGVGFVWWRRIGLGDEMGFLSERHN
jgi:hypothetical protein